MVGGGCFNRSGTWCLKGKVARCTNIRTHLMRTYRVALSLDRVGVHGASRQGLSHFRPSSWIILLLINHLYVRRQIKQIMIEGRAALSNQIVDQTGS